jgi:hypothetical protein
LDHFTLVYLHHDFRRRTRQQQQQQQQPLLILNYFTCLSTLSFKLVEGTRVTISFKWPQEFQELPSGSSL